MYNGKMGELINNNNNSSKNNNNNKNNNKNNKNRNSKTKLTQLCTDTNKSITSQIPMSEGFICG